MAQKTKRGDYSGMPLMVSDGDVVSHECINRWREYVIKQHGGRATNTLNAIFDCALLGADRAEECRSEATRLAKKALRDIARQL